MAVALAGPTSQADYDQIVRVTRLVGISHHDAEDAVQESWLRLATSSTIDTTLPAAPIMQSKARWLAMTQRRRVLRDSARLRVLDPGAGDDAVGVVRDIEDPRSIDEQLDARLELSRLAAYPPIVRERVVAQARGLSMAAKTRGEAHDHVKFSDAQVAELRQAVAAGETVAAAARRLGFDNKYAHQLVRGECRLMTTGTWDATSMKQAVVQWAREEGRAPVQADAANDPRLPHCRCAQRRFGGWRELLRQAGLTSAYADRRMTRWTRPEIIDAFVAYYRREGAWPRLEDARTDPLLPSPASITRNGGIRAARAAAECQR